MYNYEKLAWRWNLVRSCHDPVTTQVLLIMPENYDLTISAFALGCAYSCLEKAPV